MNPLMLKDKQSAVELQTGLNRKDGADNRSLHNSNMAYVLSGEQPRDHLLLPDKGKV